MERAAAYAGRWVEYHQRTGRLPGVVVAVQIGDDLVLEQAFGHADVEAGVPMTSGHLFRIASHSKMFTATAVLRLVQQGRLRLDDPVTDHLPDVARAAELDVDVSRVTVRHLLSHSSGMIRDGEDAGFWQLLHEFPTGSEVEHGAGGRPLVLRPDEHFKYSNVGYTLLGRIIEVVTGQTYADHVRTAILTPLGLEDTGPELDETARTRLAVGYSQQRYGLPRVPIAHLDTHGMSPATGFYASARDLCRFGTALYLGDDTLLDDTTKRQMQHPSFEIRGAKAHYGLGVQVQTIDDHRVIGHGGAFPGFITATRIDPEQRFVVVVLTNAIDGPAGMLADGMVKLLHRDGDATEGVDVGGDLHRFEGRFFDPWGVLDVAVIGGRLLGLDPDLGDPLEDATELEVLDDHTLRIARSNGYGAPGESVTYTFSPSGEVDHIVAAGSRRYPWPRVLDAFPGVALPTATPETVGR